MNYQTKKWIHILILILAIISVIIAWMRFVDVWKARTQDEQTGQAEESAQVEDSTQVAQSTYEEKNASVPLEGASVSSSSWYGLPGHYSPEGDIVQALFEKLVSVPKSEAVPAPFIDEVFNPVVLGQPISYVENNVVGLYWKQAPPGGAEALYDLLAKAGWSHIGVSEAGKTFIKEDGTYRWCYVSAIENHGALTAVFSFSEVLV